MDKITAMMTVSKVQTLADGGLRVTLDMSEKDVMQMAQFVECKRFGAILEAQFTPQIPNKKTEPETDEMFTFPDMKFDLLPTEFSNSENA